jgi:hypothetical protein
MKVHARNASVLLSCIVSVDPEEVAVTVGSNASFYCNDATTSLVLDVKWFINDTQLLENTTRNVVTTLKERTGELKFVNISEDYDNTEIGCEFTSELFQETSSVNATLHVFYSEFLKCSNNCSQHKYLYSNTV